MNTIKNTTEHDDLILDQVLTEMKIEQLYGELKQINTKINLIVKNSKNKSSPLEVRIPLATQ